MSARERASKYQAAMCNYVNNQYEREGEIEPEKLLVAEEVSDRIMELSKTIPDRLEELKRYPLRTRLGHSDWSSLPCSPIQMRSARLSFLELSSQVSGHGSIQ